MVPLLLSCLYCCFFCQPAMIGLGDCGSKNFLTLTTHITYSLHPTPRLHSSDSALFCQDIYNKIERNNTWKVAKLWISTIVYHSIQKINCKWV
jgi:hypothetical protein